MCLEAPDPKKHYLNGGKKVDAALKTASCTGRAGGCFPPVTCVFPANQTFSDKTHDLIVKEGSVLPAKREGLGEALHAPLLPLVTCLYLHFHFHSSGANRN